MHRGSGECHGVPGSTSPPPHCGSSRGRLRSGSPGQRLAGAERQPAGQARRRATARRCPRPGRSRPARQPRPRPGCGSARRRPPRSAANGHVDGHARRRASARCRPPTELEAAALGRPPGGRDRDGDQRRHQPGRGADQPVARPAWPRPPGRGPGKLRNVSVIVPCRYSPATARMPNISVNSAARPTCASAVLWVAGSCTLPPDWTRPVTPATTSSGPRPAAARGRGRVLSLRNSLRITGWHSSPPRSGSGTPTPGRCSSSPISRSGPAKRSCPR